MKKFILTIVIMLILTALCGISVSKAEYQAYAVIGEDSVLNVRKKPWIGSTVIGWILNGQSVDVVAIEGSWAKCHVNLDDGEYGYIKIEYLTTRPGDIGVYENYTNGRVRVRKTCGGKSSGWLKKGASVTVYGWMLDKKGIEYARTNKGWIAADCLTKK